MKPQSPELTHELRLLAEGQGLVAGLDEAGRGAFAGPLVAGAVILPVSAPGLAERLAGVRDSKTCTPRTRERFMALIQENALSTASGAASAQEIDTLGVVKATRLAMARALEGLTLKPDALLIDYLRLPGVDLPQLSLVRGEQQSLSIAAASIVAKVTRDHMMVELGAEHTAYGFEQHKGYGTARHRAALLEHGPCVHHRLSFRPVQQMRFPEEINP